MDKPFLMLITADNKAIWAQGIKPEEVLFSATVTPSVEEAKPFRVASSADAAKDAIAAASEPTKKSITVEYSAAFKSAPTWAKAIPALGLVLGIFYAAKKKKGIAACAGYGAVGAMIFAAPLNYYLLDEKQKSK